MIVMASHGEVKSDGMGYIPGDDDKGIGERGDTYEDEATSAQYKKKKTIIVGGTEREEERSNVRIAANRCQLICPSSLHTHGAHSHRSL